MSEPRERYDEDPMDCLGPCGESENECRICHELFLTRDGSNICDRCHREQIINDEP